MEGPNIYLSAMLDGYGMRHVYPTQSSIDLVLALFCTVSVPRFARWCTLVPSGDSDATQRALPAGEHVCFSSSMESTDFRISDADLHDLLAFALSHPAVKGTPSPCSTPGGETTQTLGDSEKLHESASYSDGRAIRTGAKAFLRLLKRVYTMRARNLGTTVDPEALWHLADELSTRDDEGV